MKSRWVTNRKHLEECLTCSKYQLNIITKKKFYGNNYWISKNRSNCWINFWDLISVSVKTKAVHIGRSTNTLTGLRDLQSWELYLPTAVLTGPVLLPRPPVYDDESSLPSVNLVLILWTVQGNYIIYHDPELHRIMEKNNVILT